MYDTEAKLVAMGWLWLLGGLIGAAFCVIYGLFITAASFVLWILLGLYILINTFKTYQWPNRHEYIDFWKGFIRWTPSLAR